MRIFVGGMELTELVEKVEWSGDHKQVARQVVFTIAKSHSDPNFPDVRFSAGATVILQNDFGATLFYGKIFKVNRTASATVASYTALDLLFYILKSSSSWIIDETPEAFTARVCAEFGVPLAYAQETGVHVYSLAFNKTGYQAIMMAYTEAYRQNAGLYAYIPLMDGGALMVIPKGMDSGVVLEPGGSLIDADYDEDATVIVNKVLITDKDGNHIGSVDDGASQAQYGTIQHVITQEEGKDAHAEAASEMKGLERAASATGFSDYRARAGYSLLIREPDTGLYGRFHIDNDKHTFTDGKATMALTLNYETKMDEHELGK